VIHISDTGTDRVERLERTNEHAGREYLDADAAIARRARLSFMDVSNPGKRLLG
jgi:hypothetical protein